MSTESQTENVRQNERSSSWLSNVSYRTALLYIALYGTAILFLVPYAYMVSTSLKTRSGALSTSFHWIPHPISLHWYAHMLIGGNVPHWVLNSLVISVGTTVLVLVVDSLIAFALTRIEWPGRRYVFGLIVASFMVPGFVNIIPLYTLITKFGLVNSDLAVILPFAAGPLGVFLLVQFFRDIPREMQEAARLDGFSTFRIYTRLVLPLSKSALSALGLFIFVWSWNQFLWPLIVFQDEGSYTLPIGLVTFQSTHAFNPAVNMTGAVITSVPLFVLFLLLQDRLVDAVAMQAGTK